MVVINIIYRKIMLAVNGRKKNYGRSESPWRWSLCLELKRQSSCLSHPPIPKMLSDEAWEPDVPLVSTRRLIDMIWHMIWHVIGACAIIISSEIMVIDLIAERSTGFQTGRSECWLWFYYLKYILQCRRKLLLVLWWGCASIFLSMLMSVMS